MLGEQLRQSTFSHELAYAAAGSDRTKCTTYCCCGCLYGRNSLDRYIILPSCMNVLADPPASALTCRECCQELSRATTSLATLLPLLFQAMDPETRCDIYVIFVLLYVPRAALVHDAGCLDACIRISVHLLTFTCSFTIGAR